MSIETARSFLLWCSVINFGLLIVWGLVAVFGRALLYPIQQRLFRLSAEQMNLLNVAGITLYEMGIFLFNVVPCIALYLIK
jgi:hypothetical protein